MIGLTWLFHWIIEFVNRMNAILRKRTLPSIDEQLKNIHLILEKLSNDYHSLEEKCHRWIVDEQKLLFNRIAKLERDNYHLHQSYRTCQIEHERCLKTLTDRILQVLRCEQSSNKPAASTKKDDTKTNLSSRPPATPTQKKHRSEIPVPSTSTTTSRTNKLYFALDSLPKAKPSNVEKSTKTSKSRIPTPIRNPAKATDLDVVMAEKSKKDRPLFHPETVKLVRRDELKSFSSQLPSEVKENVRLSVDSLSREIPSETPPKVKIKANHRLVFPVRLGRLFFPRRIYSDSDIYQKNCSKDHEIEHNVYHLDTIRDYSMEFYMLTSYGSDSQLSAWFNTDGEEIVDEICQWDEHRYEDETSLIEQDELDWYPDIEPLTQSSQQKGRTISTTDQPLNEILNNEQFFHSSSTLTSSTEWSSSLGAHDNLSPTENTAGSSRIEAFESSLPEFQSDFYYLCPMTTTTSFTKIEHQKEIDLV